MEYPLLQIFTKRLDSSVNNCMLADFLMLLPVLFLYFCISKQVITKLKPPLASATLWESVLQKHRCDLRRQSYYYNAWNHRFLGWSGMDLNSLLHPYCLQITGLHLKCSKDVHESSGLRRVAAEYRKVLQVILQIPRQWDLC